MNPGESHFLSGWNRTDRDDILIDSFCQAGTARRADWTLSCENKALTAQALLWWSFNPHGREGGPSPLLGGTGSIGTSKPSDLSPWPLLLANFGVIS